MKKYVSCKSKASENEYDGQSGSNMKILTLKHFPSKSTEADSCDDMANNLQEMNEENVLQGFKIGCKAQNEEVLKKNYRFSLFENYRLLQNIGKGSFGEVHRAIYIPESKQIALKIIDFAAFQEAYDAEVRRLFELQKLVSLTLRSQGTSQFFPEIFQAFSEGNRGFICCQYIAGCTLEEIINYGKDCLSDQQIKYILASLLLSIDELHQKINCIYRDLKPSNIMILPNGSLKLIDFGSVKFMENSERTSSIIGTCEYFSPERAAFGSYGKSADIWSFAVIAYELVTGKLPFALDALGDCGDQQKISHLSKQLKKKIKCGDIDCEPIEEGLGEILEGILNCRDLKEREKTWTIENIKKSKYFSNFPWPLLEKGKLPAPQNFTEKQIQQFKDSFYEPSAGFMGF